jgi:MFS family permease
LYVVALNHAVNDGSVYLLSTLFPILQILFGLSYAQIGILLGMGYFVPVVCQPIIGHYGEHRRPIGFLGFGILLIAISIFSFTYSTGFASLLVSFLILRIGSSFFHPIGISAVSRTYEGPGLQTSMAFQSAFGNMGVLLVFLTVSPIYILAGWKITFIFFTIVAFATVAVTVGLLRTDTLVKKVRPHVLKEVNTRFEFLKFLIFFLIVAFVSGGSYAVILNFANLFLTQHEPQLSLSQVNLVVSSFILAAFLGALSTRICLRGTAYSTGASFGGLSSAQTVGASVFGLVSGLTVSSFGISAPFLMVAIILIIAVFLTLTWIKRHQDVTMIDNTAEPIVTVDPAQE